MMIIKLFSKLSKKERAQSMVEFALIFPVLLLITYGIIEIGRMLFIYIALTNAAREGARHGAAAGDIDELNRTPHYADCDGILDAVHTCAFLTELQDSDINIDYDHGPDTGVFAAECPPYDGDGNDLVRLRDRIVVTVNGRYDPIVPVGFLGFSGFDIVTHNARTILLNIEIVGTPPPSVYTVTPTPYQFTDTYNHPDPHSHPHPLTHPTNPYAHPHRYPHRQPRSAHPHRHADPHRYCHPDADHHPHRDDDPCLRHRPWPIGFDTTNKFGHLEGNQYWRRPGPHGAHQDHLARRRQSQSHACHNIQVDGIDVWTESRHRPPIERLRSQRRLLELYNAGLPGIASSNRRTVH